MLNTDQDAYVMHFFGHEETAERLLHILKHEDCHSYINDDDNMATFEYKWKIADGIQGKQLLRQKLVNQADDKGRNLFKMLSWVVLALSFECPDPGPSSVSDSNLMYPL